MLAAQGSSRSRARTARICRARDPDPYIAPRPTYYKQDPRGPLKDFLPGPTCPRYRESRRPLDFPAEFRRSTWTPAHRIEPTPAKSRLEAAEKRRREGSPRAREDSFPHGSSRRQGIEGNAGDPRPLPRPVDLVVGLSSPKLTENEVESFSRMANVSDDVLRIIGKNRAWTKNYSVIVGLTKNPKTPVAMSMNFLARLSARDLGLLAVDRNVAEPLRIAAKKRVSAGSKKQE